MCHGNRGWVCQGGGPKSPQGQLFGPLCQELGQSMETPPFLPRFSTLQHDNLKLIQFAAPLFRFLGLHIGTHTNRGPIPPFLFARPCALPFLVPFRCPLVAAAPADCSLGVHGCKGTDEILHFNSA